MVPFQMSQYVLCVLPSILVRIDGTQPTMRPASRVTAQERPVYLRDGTAVSAARVTVVFTRFAVVVVFARFLFRHLTGQGVLGYPAGENLG